VFRLLAIHVARRSTLDGCDLVSKTIGETTWDELDTRVSHVRSIVPEFVPARVRRRRERLRALRDELRADLAD
jgi:hypothetical protein